MTSILLITKNYPPQLGGIEKYAYDLHYRLEKEGNVVYLIHAYPRNEYLFSKKKSSLFLALFYYISEFLRLFIFGIMCIFLGSFYASRSNFIWALDGSLSPVSLLLGNIIKKGSRVTIHGTDIVWNNLFYQKIIPTIVAKIDEVYVISDSTFQECLKRGIPRNRLILTPHTLQSISFQDPGEFDKYEFLSSLGLKDPKKRKILFSVGRWVERKGFHWFIEEVIGTLNEMNHNEFVYFLAGFGPYENVYRKIIAEKNITNVILVGQIDEISKARLYKSSDFFVMPNIEVSGDIEGFGLVLLEAQFYKVKSIVANLNCIGDDSRRLNIVLGTGNKKSWVDFFSTIV